MKIKFEDGKEFEIIKARYQYDENDVPVDIILWGDVEILYAITKYAYLGYNMRECSQSEILLEDLTRYSNDIVYIALYARLQNFTIIYDDIVEYESSIHSI